MNLSHFYFIIVNCNSLNLASMKPLVPLFITFLAFFTSCGSSSTSSTNYQDPHSGAHSKMHNEFYQEEIQKELNKQVNTFVGVYEGTLPCADCEGIKIQLELFQDMTYAAEVSYKGKSDTIEKSVGSFALKVDSIIELDKGIGGLTFFRKEATDLIVLDQNAKEIISGMNDAYILKGFKKKVKTYESDDPKAIFLKKKWDEGIAFYALGNEPSWSLDLSQADSLTFKAPNGKKYSFPVTESLAIIDPNIIDYRLYTDEAEILVQMVQKPCNDSMSGNSFSYQVNITFKLASDKDGQVFQGCGDFVPNYNLNGKWKIIKAGDILIDKNSFPNQEPYIILDLYRGTVSGNDGCNSFFGQIAYQTDQISFGPTAGTLMACTNMELSSTLMGLISEKTMTFNLANDLTLNSDNEKIMVLRRYD